MACPQPRHLDMAASLKDPMGQLSVRTFRQRSSIPLYVVADLSASMGFRGQASKLALLADFTAAVARSAMRIGDRFGFVGCDSEVRDDWRLPLRLHKDGAEDWCARLRTFKPRASQMQLGLEAAAGHLGRQKALVFLVSDFHYPPGFLVSVLDSLGRHDVVPVVLWDSAEYQRLPSWGLALVSDPETGRQRPLFMRPHLKARFYESFLQRKTELTDQCLQRGRPPFFLIDHFHADELTDYFLASG